MKTQLYVSYLHHSETIDRNERLVTKPLFLARKVMVEPANRQISIMMIAPAHHRASMHDAGSFDAHAAYSQCNQDVLMNAFELRRMASCSEDVGFEAASEEKRRRQDVSCNSQVADQR